jgi:hypothetical protein
MATEVAGPYPSRLLFEMGEGATQRAQCTKRRLTQDSLLRRIFAAAERIRIHPHTTPKVIQPLLNSVEKCIESQRRHRAITMI